jgi:type II secretory pathway pseudopilin PulG
MDFSSWQGVFSTLLGLAIVTLIGVGIRVVMMQTIQQRRERMNRQINERLRTLIAAYKVLGGSFTGELTVDPTHLRDLRATGQDPQAPPGTEERRSSDRARRTRDAVEAALADILLLGTEEHCRLAGQAASDMAAGRPIHTAGLVISLRAFVREALDLGPMPGDVVIPLQGPARTQGGAGRAKGEGAGGGGGKGGAGQGGAGGGGGGMGMGLGVGLGAAGQGHGPAGHDEEH